MRTGVTKKIRAVLRAAPDGMTTAEIAAAIPDASWRGVRHALQFMPDAYIDRWENVVRLAAVWCVVVPPDNAPRPEPKYPNQGLRKRALRIAKITPLD